MNWNNRFPAHDLGHQVLETMSDLKIHIYKCNGKTCAEFELSGRVGPDPFDDDDEEGDTAKADDLSLLADLLREFQRERE